MTRMQGCIAALGLACFLSTASAQEPVTMPPMRISTEPVTTPSGSGFTAGVGVFFAKPRFDNVTAITTITTTVAAPIVTTTESNRNFDFGVQGAPKVWLGYGFDGGFSMRATWWQLDAHDSLFQLVTPGGPGSTTRVIIPNIAAASDDVLTKGFGVPRQGVIVVDSGAVDSAAPVSVSGRFKIDVLDLDFMQTIDACGWNLNAGGGLRYARLNQSMHADARNEVGGAAIVFQSLDQANLFEGIGPQACFEAHRKLGAGFSLYGNARLGIVFGDNRLTAAQLAQATTGAGVIAAVSPAFRGNTSNTSRTFGELEAGIEWSYCFGRITPFAQIGLSAQQWTDAGSPTSTINNKGGDLSLFGLLVNAGARY